MTSKAIQEALNQVSSQEKEVKSNPKNEVLIGNNDFAQVGFEDGYSLSINSYSYGFRLGVEKGIIKARNEAITGALSNLRTLRATPITIDVNQLCDNLPTVNRPLFLGEKPHAC